MRFESRRGQIEKQINNNNNNNNNNKILKKLYIGKSNSLLVIFFIACFLYISKMISRT
jgi:hypothetical protein